MDDQIEFGLKCIGTSDIYGCWAKAVVIKVSGKDPLIVTGVGEVDVGADIIFEQPGTGIKMYLRWYKANVFGAEELDETFLGGDFAPVVSPFGTGEGLEDNIDAGDLITFDDLAS